MKKDYKLLIFSFFLLNIYSWIIYVEATYGIPKMVKYFISLSVFGVIVYYKIKNPAKLPPGKASGAVILIFILSSLLLIISAVLKANSLYFIQLTFADPLFLMPYLLPLLILFTRFDLDFFGYLLYYSFVLVVVGIIVQIMTVFTGMSRLDWVNQVNMIRIFELGSSLLLLVSHIIVKNKVSNAVLGYYLFWIIIWSYFGRRGALVNIMLLFAFMIFIRLKSSLLTTNDRMKIYLTGMFLIIFFVAFGYLLTSTYAFQRGFSRDAIESSRGSVFEAFFFDFGNEKDWLIGRGLQGTVLRSLNTYSQYTAIENGFLTLLLKGGLFYAVPYLFILLRATYLGLFRSNNDLVKAMASIILIYFIMMVHFNLPSYSTSYILLWVFVSACFSTSFRRYSNLEVLQSLNAGFK